MTTSAVTPAEIIRLVREKKGVKINIQRGGVYCTTYSIFFV